MTTTTQKTFAVYVARRWRNNPDFPEGWEPSGSEPRRYLAKGIKTEAEAQSMVRQWDHDNPSPGKYAPLAMYESEPTPTD